MVTAAGTIGLSHRPSSTDRTFTCTASVPAVQHCKPSPGSAASVDGNVQHELLDEAMKLKVDPYTLVGKEYPKYLGVPVNEDMCGWVTEAIEYIESVKASGTVMYSEGEASLPIQYGNTWAERGTTDYTLLMADGWLHIFDYKGGGGILVYPDSYQLKNYALGVVQQLASIGIFPSNIRLHIMQPRRGHMPTLDMTMEDMYAFAEFAEERIIESLGPNAVFRPSKKACMWCPIKKTCKARGGQAVAGMSAQFGLGPQGEVPPTQQLVNCDLAVPADRSRAELTDEQVNGMLQYVDDAIAFYRGLWSYAEEKELKEPGSFPSWKMVEGKLGDRAWASPEAGLAAMKASKLKKAQQYGEPKMISPTQAAKLVGAVYAEAPNISKKKGSDMAFAEFSTAVVRKEGKPLLVPATDSRSAIEGTSTASKFNTST